MIYKKLFAIFVASFGLNWIWENLHSVLYYLPSGEQITQVLLLKSTFFDALFVTMLLWLFLHYRWLRQRSWLIIVTGVIIAILVEKYALASNMWAYTIAMPIVPLVQTGLTPTIQLGVTACIVYLFSEAQKAISR